MELGQTVYFFDPKTKDIKEAVLIGINIGHTGYELCSLFINDSVKQQIEMAHVFDIKEDAEAHKDRVSCFIDLAEEEIKKTTEAVDDYRVKVIGRPAHKELADKLIK